GLSHTETTPAFDSVAQGCFRLAGVMALFMRVLTFRLLANVDACLAARIYRAVRTREMRTLAADDAWGENIRAFVAPVVGAAAFRAVRNGHFAPALSLSSRSR